MFQLFLKLRPKRTKTNNLFQTNKDKGTSHGVPFLMIFNLKQSEKKIDCLTTTNL